MTGRFENEREIELRCEEKVKKMPSYVSRWYLNLKASRKTAATRRDYINKIYNFLSSIKENVNDVSPQDINEESVTKYFLSIQTKKTLNGDEYTSDSYQDTVWCCLDNFLGYLNNTKIIPNNYIKLIEKPKNRDLERINEKRVLLTENDFKKILNAVDEERSEYIRKRDRAILLTFMNTGMRETALTEILMQDFDYLNKKLYVVDKGSKRHTYDMNEQFVDAIFEWIAVCPFLEDRHMFLTQQGDKMSISTVKYLVYKYTERALGKPLSPHKLRAGYCSILYNKTHDIEFVRRAVGHSNVSTTQRYIVTAEEEKRRAAEIMGSIL